MRKAGALFKLSLVTLSLMTISQAFAGGFELWEETGVGTGDYHAGAAAEGDDGSLEYYNAAQVTDIKHQQISVGGVIIPMSVKFNGTISFLNVPSTGKSDITNFVPNFHYVLPLPHKLFFTFGVTAPFGLETNYNNSDAAGQMKYGATKTQLLTININPSLAYKLTNHISVAVGFDALYGKADYANKVDNTTNFTNDLNGWGFGYNLGAWFKFNLIKSEQTKLGVSYRSGIRVDASGPSKYQGRTTTATSKIDLPSTTIISIYQPITPRWAVMASAYYTNWDVFADLVMNNTAFSEGGYNITVHENYRNTWNFAVGTHVKLTDSLTWKLGGGYDQTPTRNGYRDVRLPDVNRWALSTGLRWHASRALALELGYTHLFTPTAKVDNTSGAVGPIPLTLGTAKLNANVFAGQLTWTL